MIVADFMAKEEKKNYDTGKGLLKVGKAKGSRSTSADKKGSRSSSAASASKPGSRSSSAGKRKVKIAEREKSPYNGGNSGQNNWGR